MIKTVLKHFIYDKCIEVLFDNIADNFVSSFKNFKVGDKLLYIDEVYNCENHCYVSKYKDVEIMKVSSNGKLCFNWHYLQFFSTKAKECVVYITQYGSKMYCQSTISKKEYDETDVAVFGMSKYTWINPEAVGRYKKL